MSSLYLNGLEAVAGVPNKDSELQTVQTQLASVLTGIASLSYQRVQCWVVSDDSDPAARKLSANIDVVTWSGEQTPDSSEVSAMCLAIRTAIIADPNFSALGVIDVSCWINSAYYLWSEVGGVLTPVNTSAIIPYVHRMTNMPVYGGAINPGVPKLLDLSSVVGSRVARVWLQYEQGDSAAMTTIITQKANGDGRFPVVPTGPGGTCAGELNAPGPGEKNFVELTSLTSVVGVVSIDVSVPLVFVQVILADWVPLTP